VVDAKCAVRNFRGTHRGDMLRERELQPLRGQARFGLDEHVRAAQPVDSGFAQVFGNPVRRYSGYLVASQNTRACAAVSANEVAGTRKEAKKARAVVALRFIMVSSLLRQR
jgi:hypothetical protein